MTSSQTAAYRDRQRHYRAEVRLEGPEDLNSDMQQMVRQRLSTRAYPRESNSSPHTVSLNRARNGRILIQGSSASASDYRSERNISVSGADAPRPKQ